MTNAPQRIHVTASHDGDTGSWNKNRINERFGLTQTEFVRADIAQAMVAAAYEVAAFECEGSNLGLTAEDVADDIRAHTPADARSTLDAMVAKAHEEGKAEGLKEAAAIVPQVIQAYALMKPGKPDQYASREAQIVAKGFARLIEEEILALIPTVKDAR